MKRTLFLIALVGIIIQIQAQNITGTLRGGWHKATTQNDGTAIGDPLSTYFEGIGVYSNAYTDDVIGGYTP